MRKLEYTFAFEWYWLIGLPSKKRRSWKTNITGQYHACWCHGDTRNQGISCTGFECVGLEYFMLHTIIYEHCLCYLNGFSTFTAFFFQFNELVLICFANIQLCSSTITYLHITVKPLIYVTLVANKIVDHWDVVGAAPVCAAPTTSSFLT